MLQDLWEDYIDVDVGKVKKIDPTFLAEEKLDCLIIGDVVNEAIASSEVLNWLLKFREISNIYSLIVKAVSGFYISPYDIKREPVWVENLQENVKVEMIYPPILSLKLNRAELILENGAPDLVKAFSNDLIDFIINDKIL